MKPAVIAGRAVPAHKLVKTPPLGELLREHVTLCDLTDCLLSAYDGVARLAYEKFRIRGKDSAGNELQDWLDAESELLGQMEVDVAESGDFVNALASVPGYRSVHISLGVEGNGCWSLRATVPTNTLTSLVLLTRFKPCADRRPLMLSRWLLCACTPREINL